MCVAYMCTCIHIHGSFYKWRAHSVTLRSKFHVHAVMLKLWS